MSLEQKIEDLVKAYEKNYGSKPDFVMIEASSAGLYLNGKFGARICNKDYTLLGNETISGCIPLVVPKIGYDLEVFSERDLSEAVLKYQQGDNSNYKVVIEKEKLIPRSDSTTSQTFQSCEIEYKEIHFHYIDTYMNYKEFHPN